MNKVGVSRKTLMKDLVALCNRGLVSYAIFRKHNNPRRNGNIPRLTVRGQLAAQRVHESRDIPQNISTAIEFED